jgi:murein DD-endopeptidase MepM/ murein hydrolase activator NlpD
MKASMLLPVLLLAITVPAAAGVQPSAAEGAPGNARTASTHPGWGWPLSPKPGVLRSFDPPARKWMSGHRGVDLGPSSAAAAVTSPAAGTISFAGVVVDRPVITVDHGNGLRSSFEPVESSLAAGTAVAKGQELGRLQPGHCAAVPCLHWGVRQGEEYLNPLGFVEDLRPSVLLPLEQ